MIMIVVGEIRPLDVDEVAFRRKALRDAVACIGWIKIVSIICYVGLYFFVNAQSEGHMSNVLKIMILVVIPLEILNGILLLLGSLHGKIFALEVGLWLCLLIASYNTILGAMGGIYFIRTGHLTVHFMLACIFILFGISLITTMCNDYFIINSYKKVLRSLSTENL